VISCRHIRAEGVWVGHSFMRSEILLMPFSMLQLRDVNGGRYLTAIRRGGRCIDIICAGQEMVRGKLSVIVFENSYGKLTVANQNLQPG